MFENEDSDMVNNDTIVKIPDNRAGEDLTKKFTVYVKCEKKKNNKVVTTELSKFVKLTKTTVFGPLDQGITSV